MCGEGTYKNAATTKVTVTRLTETIRIADITYRLLILHFIRRFTGFFFQPVDGTHERINTSAH